MDNENPLTQIHAPNSNVLGPSSWLDLIQEAVTDPHWWEKTLQLVAFHGEKSFISHLE